jgi:VIT1/CCC1 family predicted Fe2+/Mn2+ transporter
MKHQLKTGLSFGLTSAIITTLGLMIGLISGTESKIVVIGGILTIAIADAFSDALGIHLSEESEGKHTRKEIWEASLVTFIFKFIFGLSFLPAILIFPLSLASIVNIFYGLFLLSIFSYFLAKWEREAAWKVILEHLIVAILVIFLANWIGIFIKNYFG